MGRNQLIAGRNDTNRQRLDHRDLRLTDGCQCADILRRQHTPLLQDHLTWAYIVAPEDHIFTGSGGFRDTNGAIAVIFRVFQHHNAVSTLGDSTAGGNSRTGIGVQDKRGILPHEHLCLQPENRRDRVTAPKGISGPDRITVYGRAVEIRHILHSRDILR